MNNKKFYNNNLVRYYNFTYNFLFKLLNNIEIDLTEDDIKFLKKKGYLNSKGLGTVWLLNLKRLYNILKKKIITQIIILLILVAVMEFR